MSDDEVEADFETNAFTVYKVFCEGCDDVTELEWDPVSTVVDCEWCEAKIRVMETR